MRLELPNNAVRNPLVVMRRAGYSPFTDPVTKAESFVLSLSTAFYPRFHVYVEQTAQKLIFNIHLDQKQPSYGQGHAHGGEYEGSAVEREAKRISSWANAVMREEHTTPSKNEVEKDHDKAPKHPKKWYSWFLDNIS